MASKDTKLKLSDEEVKKLSGAPTKTYLKSVMQKLFKDKWSLHLDRLLSGDRDTLETCAGQLAKNLDFFPLLHTLCLVTGQRFDLNEKDHVKAADAWLCWFSDHSADLRWDDDEQVWRVKK